MSSCPLISKTHVSWFSAILEQCIWYGWNHLSSSFHWYYIHTSRMHITHTKRNSRTPYVVTKIQGDKTLKSFFLKWQKNMTGVSANKATKYICHIRRQSLDLSPVFKLRSLVIKSFKTVQLFLKERLTHSRCFLIIAEIGLNIAHYILMNTHGKYFKIPVHSRCLKYDSSWFDTYCNKIVIV